MAFNIEKFTSAYGQTVSTRTICRWGYQTADVSDYLVTNNYFEEVRNQIKEGDIIETQHVDANGHILETIEYFVAHKDIGADFLVCVPKRAGDIISTCVLDDVSTASSVGLTFAGGSVALKSVYCITEPFTGSNPVITITDSNSEEAGSFSVEDHPVEHFMFTEDEFNTRIDNTFTVTTNGLSAGVAKGIFVFISTSNIEAYQVSGEFITLFARIDQSEVETNTSQRIAVPFDGTIERVYMRNQFAYDTSADVVFYTSVSGVRATEVDVDWGGDLVGRQKQVVDKSAPIEAGDYLEVGIDGNVESLETSVWLDITYVIRIDPRYKAELA